MDHATPVAHVSAFCCAVMKNIIPHEFWGVGEVRIVLSLREYLLSKLPTASKVRRKKILSVGERKDVDPDDERELCDLLDKTLVGVLSHDGLSEEDRSREWVSFSQQGGDTSLSTIGNSSGDGIFSISKASVYQ